jgi:hypothetical protein
VLLKRADAFRDPPTDHSQASRILTASSERVKCLRRIEQSLLPDGGPDDDQPAQMADRMAGDELAELLGKPDHDALGPADVG